MNNLLSESDRQAVFDLLIEQLNVSPAQLTAQARLRADLGSDSLDDVEIAMALEDRFGVSIPEDLLNADLTVGDLLQTLETVVAAQRAGPATGEPTGRINPVGKA